LIKSFKHKGLQKFFHTGSKAGIQPSHATKLNLQLFVLDQADSIDDVDVNGWFLHRLQGTLEGHWSIRVNGNWRITFRFIDKNVEVVDYHDYH